MRAVKPRIQRGVDAIDKGLRDGGCVAVTDDGMDGCRIDALSRGSMWRQSRLAERDARTSLIVRRRPGGHRVLLIRSPLATSVNTGSIARPVC